MAQLDDVMAALRNAEATGNKAEAHRQAQLADQLQHSSHGSDAGGGAAQAPAPSSMLPKPAGDILSATAIGAAFGAASPEILTGAGAAVSMIPGGEVVGVPLMAAGRALRASRVAEALSGAVQGVVSESAGQLAEAKGASAGQAAAIRFGAGFVAPAVGISALQPFIGTSSKVAVQFLHHLTGGGEGPVSMAVQKATKTLAGTAVQGQPQAALHAALGQAVAEDVKAAHAAAQKVMTDARAKAAPLWQTARNEAERVMGEAQSYVKSLLDAAESRKAAITIATKGKAATAARVNAMADQALTIVGKPAELSTIGNALRGRVTAENEKLIQQRAAEYKATETTRDQVVAGNEAMGKFLDSMPSMQALKKDISTKLLLTKAGMAAAGGKAAVTEPGVKMAYQKVYDAIANRRVQTGVNEAGNPTYQTFKTTFGAVDAVRRKLGDAAFGQDAEGYAALGQSVARDLYGKISKIQEEYAGPAQSKLQADYAEATYGMSKARSASGKKLLAADRADPNSFMVNPKDLPAKYFSSSQGVKDLQELTGDHVVVANAAQSYTARTLQGMSAKQVTTWLKDPKQTDWMREIPGLQERARQYVGQLERIETASGKIEANITKLAKEQKGLRPAAEAAGAKHIDQTYKGLIDKAEAVVKAPNPSEAARKLFKQGTPDEQQRAIRAVAGTPGGKEAIIGSVRQVLAEVPPGKLRETYQEQVRPSLQHGGVLPRAELEKLDNDVTKVLQRYEGKAAVSKVARLVSAAMRAGVVTSGGMLSRVDAGAAQ